MAFWDDLKAIFRREARDARDWADDAVADGNRALDDAERRLSASPDERLAATLSDIEAQDDAFEALRAKADAATAGADARGELVEDGPDDPAEG
ncbi:hypothetical protein [Euzebya sp.]|uniref:hypothetical protein n=1 Tax=Euzebya sp. TaxID=1971409 RepID=UPI0035173768